MCRGRPSPGPAGLDCPKTWLAVPLRFCSEVKDALEEGSMCFLDACAAGVVVQLVTPDTFPDLGGGRGSSLP